MFIRNDSKNINGIDQAILQKNFFRQIIISDELKTYPCHFPASAAELGTFFKSHASVEYIHFSKQTINRIRTQAEMLHIDTHALSIFENSFLHVGNPKNFFPYTSIAFHIYTESIKTLDKIADYLDNASLSPNLKFGILTELSTQLRVCAPGCFTIIQNAYRKLINNPSIKMMTIRKEIAEQCALSLIRKYNVMYPAITQGRIEEGNITHYVAAILNRYRFLFGLEMNPDQLLPTEREVTIFYREFLDMMYESLDLTNILNTMLSHIQLEEFFENINKSSHNYMEFLEAFEFELNAYGEDKTFSITSLMNQDKLNNENVYERSPHAIDYLILTLLIRLENNRYIALEPFYSIMRLTNGDHLYYAPSYPLQFSYVIESGITTPIIEYCMQKELANENEAFYCLSDKHQNDLVNEANSRSPIPEYSRLILSRLDLHTKNQQHLFLTANSQFSKIERLFGCLDETTIRLTSEHFNTLMHHTPLPSPEFIYSHLVSMIVAVFNVTDDNFEFFKESITDKVTFIAVFEAIPINQRYQFLMMFPNNDLNKYLDHLALDPKQLIVFLQKYINLNDRFNVLIFLSAVNPTFFSINSSVELGILLNNLPSQHYVDLLKFKIGYFNFRSLLSTYDAIIQTVNHLSSDQTILFLEIIGVWFYSEVLNNDIEKLGIILRRVASINQVVLLRSWWDLSTLFITIDQLALYLGDNEKINNLHFLLSLPSTLLPMIMLESRDIRTMMHYVPVVHYAELIERINVETCKSLIPTAEAFALFLNEIGLDMESGWLPTEAAENFIQAFSAVLTPDEITHYSAGDVYLQRRMLQYRDSALRIPAVSSTGFFSLTHPNATPVNAAPSVGYGQSYMG